MLENSQRFRINRGAEIMSIMRRDRGSIPCEACRKGLSAEGDKNIHEIYLLGVWVKSLRLSHEVERY